MKSIIAVTISIVFCLTAAFAVKPVVKSEITTFTGNIIDNHCATAHKDSLTSFVASHTKECVLAPDCAKSGFSIYTEDGMLMAFDKSSNATVKKFLENSKNSLTVIVNGKKEKMGVIKLISIKNKNEPAAK